MNIPKNCAICNHPLVYFPEYGKSFCPVCEKQQLERFSEWVKQQKIPKTQETKEEKEHVLEEEIKHQDHINKAALKAVLLKHLEESKRQLESGNREEFLEGKITAYQEILRLIVSDTGTLASV